MRVFNWGILGTGNIASAMAEALDDVEGARRRAIASRSLKKAMSFADKWSFEAAYGSYDELFADPDVEIVYVATPNACHADNILDSLAAGKHVLCEKPMTLTVKEARECFAEAERSGLMLMEALWTAFFPATRKAIELVHAGVIGRPHYLQANFVSYRDRREWPVLFDADLGGGARNDLGIYPVAAALLLAGPVSSISSEVVIGSTGVDEMVAMNLVHKNGVVSQLACGFRVNQPITVRIVGDKGTLEIADEFHHPRYLHLETRDGRKTFDLPPIGIGYAHEAIAFQKLVASGACRPSGWPREYTLACAEILEAVPGRKTLSNLGMGAA